MSASENEPSPGMAPVAELGRVLRELLRREAEIDRREVEGGEKPDARAELWRQTNLEAIDGIELAIASLAASGLAEAALQILIAAGYANQVADELEEPRLREPAVRLARLLRSALPVVARSAGVDLEGYRAERYAQGDWDWPFAPGEPDEAADQSPPSAAAAPRPAAAEEAPPLARHRSPPLSLVEPPSEDGGAEREGEASGPEADEPDDSPQNAIVMPILDMLFAEAGCATKRQGERD